MSSFDLIFDRARQRKGSSRAVVKNLPQHLNADEIASKEDAWFLEIMTKCIFQAGFVWRVVENKWPDFQEAFFNFDSATLMGLSPDQWEHYREDSRIIRNATKIRSVQHNLFFIHDTSIEHGSFGHFIAEWPDEDLVSLMLHLKKKGSRLGGMTGQRFLRMAGKDSFILTHDVVSCLQLQGLDISDNPTSKKDLTRIQQQFNEWKQETGHSFGELSMIMARSVGENRE